MTESSGGSKGGGATQSNLFYFHEVFGKKNGPNNRLAPQSLEMALPTGKSWIFAPNGQFPSVHKYFRGSKGPTPRPRGNWSRKRWLSKAHTCDFCDFFLLHFWRTSVQFVEQLIPLFWTCGDIYPEFQSQIGSLGFMLPCPGAIDSSDSLLV